MKNLPFDLIDLSLIVHIVTEGSLTAAARELGFTPAAASRRLTEVEEQLGVNLFSRTTQRLQLTARGREFLAYAKRVLAAADDAARAVRVAEPGSGGDNLAGPIRLTAPVTFGRKVVMPVLGDLLTTHPGLRLDLLLTDTVLDLAEASCDAAIRLAPLVFGQQFRAQQIGEHRRLLCAAPSYIARRGVPGHAGAFAHHDGLLPGGVDGWILRLPGGEARLVRPHVRMTSNSTDALYEACLAGVGIGAHAMWEVADRLADGSLVALPASIGEPDALGVWLVLREAFDAASTPSRVLAVATALKRRLEALNDAPGHARPASDGTGHADGALGWTVST